MSPLKRSVADIAVESTRTARSATHASLQRLPLAHLPGELLLAVAQRAARLGEALVVGEHLGLLQELLEPRLPRLDLVDARLDLANAPRLALVRGRRLDRGFRSFGPRTGAAATSAFAGAAGAGLAAAEVAAR